jgi:CheY-like chemotaxis protein
LTPFAARVTVFPELLTLYDETSVPLKILLADDNMTAQNTGRRILSDAGYTVVAVSNGAAALKKYASEHPDLLVLDVFMPGYSGLEVCEKLKAENAVPVLLTFSRMEPFRPEDGERVGADASLAKPFDAAELLATIERLLRAPVTPDATAPAATTASMGHSEFKDAIARSSPTSSAVEQPAVSIPQATHDDEADRPGPSIPFVDLSAGPDSDPEHTDTAVELQPAVAAALQATEDPAENGFFAFRSNTFFTASSLDHVAPSTAHKATPAQAVGREQAVTSEDPPQEPAQAVAPSKGFSESFFGSTFSAEAEAEKPAIALVPHATEEIASETSATAAPENSVEGWWSAQPSNAETADAGLSLEPAVESAAFGDITPVAEQASDDSKERADFHSVLAQLMPAVAEPTPPIDLNAPPELSVAESFASELQPDFETHREPSSLFSSAAHTPTASIDEPVKPNTQPSSPEIEISAASDPQEQWNSSLVSSMCELNDHQIDTEPSVALEPAVHSNGNSSHSNGASRPTNDVTDAVERVLARFRESLLSEVMRELSPK